MKTEYVDIYSQQDYQYSLTTHTMSHWSCKQHLNLYDEKVGPGVVSLMLAEP